MQKVNDTFHEHKVCFSCVFFFFLLHLTLYHHILVLKLVLGVEMIDKKFWKCTLCSFNDTFGVVDTIGQHVKGATHILAKKNKATIRIVGIQMTLQDYFMKGVLVGKIEYPPSYIPKIVDIPHNDLDSYCQQCICHGFHNYFINIRDDLIDVHPLLNDHMIGKGWYAEPNYTHIILGLTNEVIQRTFRHFECLTLFYKKCFLIPSFPNFRKWSSQLNSMTMSKR
jgi:hypothetical protein